MARWLPVSSSSGPQAPSFSLYFVGWIWPSLLELSSVFFLMAGPQSSCNWSWPWSRSRCRSRSRSWCCFHSWPPFRALHVLAMRSTLVSCDPYSDHPIHFLETSKLHNITKQLDDGVFSKKEYAIKKTLRIYNFLSKSL